MKNTTIGIGMSKKFFVKLEFHLYASFLCDKIVTASLILLLSGFIPMLSMGGIINSHISILMVQFITHNPVLLLIGW